VPDIYNSYSPGKYRSKYNNLLNNFKEERSIWEEKLQSIHDQLDKMRKDNAKQKIKKDEQLKVLLDEKTQIARKYQKLHEKYMQQGDHLSDLRQRFNGSHDSHFFVDVPISKISLQ
jgi:SMC interacting uncharacterized protein involved in chromosome segregation